MSVKLGSHGLWRTDRGTLVTGAGLSAPIKLTTRDESDRRAKTG